MVRILNFNLHFQQNFRSDRWGISIRRSSRLELARNYTCVDILLLNDVDALPFNYKGPTILLAKNTATLCLYVGDGPSNGQYEQPLLLSAHSHFSISNRQLIRMQNFLPSL